MMMMMMNDEVH